MRLQPDVKFPLKVASDFHLSTDIVLLDFYPNPSSNEDRLLHRLNVKWALLFYMDRTKFPTRDDVLFVSYTRVLGSKVSAQRLSRWIIATIELFYKLERVAVPGRWAAC